MLRVNLSFEGPEGDTILQALFKKNSTALAGVAQWIEYWPVNQRDASSIRSQGT